MNHRAMNHQQAEQQLMAYVDQRLSDIERALLEQHLAGCAECQHELAELQEAHAWLGQSIGVVASHAAAPDDAWAQFEARFGQSQVSRKRFQMERTSKRQQPPMSLLMGFAAAAAAIVVIGVGIAAFILLFANQPGQVAVNPTATPTPTAELIGTAPAATLSPEQIYMTQRPQSGGGNGQPDGSNGEGLPPTWTGTVRSIDAAAGTLTLDPNGEVVRIMPFTQLRLADITFDGALGTLNDLQPGASVQVDLLDAEPSPPYARTIYIPRPVEWFFEGMSYELNGGTITTIDPATGIFTINVWENEILFQYNADTRIYIDDDTPDGTPIGPEGLQIGQLLSFVSLTDQGNPRPVVQIIVEPNDPYEFAAWDKGTVTAFDGRMLTVITPWTQELTFDTGPSDFAASQGVTFGAGDVIYFKMYTNIETNEFIFTEVIKLATGQWLRLRDANGPLWP